MNCARIPGVSASGDSASTSAHPSSARAAVQGCLATIRPDGVGNTRRLGRPPHCAHSVWSTNGGWYPGSADAGGGPGSGPSRATTAATGATSRALVPLARLALNLKQFGPYVDQIHTGGAGGDHGAEHGEKGQRRGPAEDQQPHRRGQLVGG